MITLRSKLVVLGFAMAAGGTAVPAAAQAQYEVLHSFRGLPGQVKAPLLEASDGQIYGVTTKGGRGGGGMIFALRPGPTGLAFRIVHEFDRLEGREPLGALIEADGELYGTTSAGGAAGHGTIFKIDRNGAFVLLHTFQGPDGSKPVASLVRGDNGAFYGTTFEGGAHSFGTVFRLAADGTLTTLHSFDTSSGVTPDTALVRGADGHFYGTTRRTDSQNGGTVYRITVDGAHTPIHTFSGIGGGTPVIGLTRGIDDNFYFGALIGIDFLSPVTFFRITPAGLLTPLRTLDALELDGKTFGNAPMRQGTDGNFYGTLDFGGPLRNDQFSAAPGTAYRLTPAGEFRILHAFTPAEGRAFSGLVQARDGFFYGVTFDGGISEHGILFRMNATGAFTQIRHFTGLDGESPWSPPVRGADGAFYGTTVKGGLFNRGTIYRMSADGTVTTVHVFNGLDGSFPFASLLAASDGFLYGTAFRGCAGRGSIFRVAVTGAVNVVHCFLPGEGRDPFAPLIQGIDGAFYGTTVSGGTLDRGTIFRVTAGGSLTTVHSFPNAEPPSPFFSDECGNHSFGPVIQEADGSLQGTTSGRMSVGCAFVLPPGSDRVFLSWGVPPFGVTINARVYGGLTRTTEGSLYGVSYLGQLFRVRFNWESWNLGGAAVNPPIQARDGYLYGTTLTSSTGSGSIYRFDTAAVTTLKVLTETEGSFPVALIEAPDGNLYGVAAAGGPLGRGVVFRFRVQ